VLGVIGAAILASVRARILGTSVIDDIEARDEQADDRAFSGE
jgi:hypothetical protein